MPTLHCIDLALRNREPEIASYARAWFALMLFREIVLHWLFTLED